jgi:extradiol dioxygenase family protein
MEGDFNILIATLFDGKSQNSLDTIACAFGMSTGLTAPVLAKHFVSRGLVTKDGRDAETCHKLRLISHDDIAVKIEKQKNSNMEQWLSPTEEKYVVALLNVSQAMGNDWRGLADRLRRSSIEMTIFEQSGNPCKELFQVWTATGKRSRSVLLDHLHDMGRFDVIKFLTSSTSTHPVPSPSSSSVFSSSLVAAVAQQQRSTFSTVAHMIQRNGVLNGLFLAMDEEEAWLLLLKQRNLLAGAGMQSFVSDLRSK